MKMLYLDDTVAVCVKPAGLISEAGEGSLPALIFSETGREVHTVHRLDAGVGGVIVYALNGRAAAELSAQIQRGEFHKTYLAVLRGAPAEESGTYTDYLFHDRVKNKSFVVASARKGVKRAVLDYETVESAEYGGLLTLVKIRLHTGRTHQIRVQFSSRRTPLYGDGKYGGRTEKAGIALFSHKVSFLHPKSGTRMEFTAWPAQGAPWCAFSALRHE